MPIICTEHHACTTTPSSGSEGVKTEKRGDGLAQWLERWTGDPKVEGSNPVSSTRTLVGFSESKKVVLTRCRCAQTPCAYARVRKTMYAR